MAEPQECAKPEAREESRAKDGGNGSGVSSPFQAPHAGNASSSGAAAGAGLTGTSDSVTQGSSSDDTQRNQAFDLPDIFKSVPHDINISTRKDEQRGSEAPVPSTSMLPIQSGAPIHVYSSQNKSSQPVSSSSSAQSLPTPSQLLKGKQKEGSMPLSPFGQNDTNNYRADRDENQSNTSALKAFSRPGAADTQISATTSDFQAGSSLPSQHWSSLGNSAPTTILSGFSLPSEGLFPSDGSDMADLFGPGSNVLFEQIRAAMRVSPEAPPWQPPPAKQSNDHVPSQENAAVAVQDSDDDSDEGETFEFNFDLDAQINAAMASLTESAQATVASPATSNVQPVEPPTPVEQQQQQQQQHPIQETLPASTLQPSSPPSQAAKEVNAEADLTLKDAPTQAQEKAVDDDSDEEEDEDDAAAAAAQFDLDAMLASAMGQAVGAAESEPVSTGNASKEVASTPEQPERQATAPGSSDESDEDDEEEEPAFDLDAHLRQAMALAREQAPLSPGEEVVDVGTPLGPPSSDESSDDEDVNFDLDAQIGAALADQLLESVKQQGTPRQESQGPPAALPAAKEPSPDFMAHDLQNMLQAAMKQAALELEIEQQEQTTQLQGLTIAAKEQAQAFPGQPPQPPPFVPRRFAMPPKPRTRPRVEDDGDPENAYNKSRQSHPQALHTPYKCDFKGCDKAFAKLLTLQVHRQTHQGVKPHKCHLCPATFATNQEFHDHSWTHNRTREWKYRCKGCFNLFGDKGMFDQHVAKARDVRCGKGECELQMRPAGARVTMPPINPDYANGAASGVNHDNYFVTSSFDQSALLAATLVHQMSSLLARQYDRQTSLLGPTDPRIDVNLALRQTFQRAGLTANETAALATVLASVGYARNEGLKASLDEARKAQFEAYRSHQERQRRAAIKQIKRERKRIQQAADRAAAAEKRKADQAALAERRKQAEAQKNGDIPVPQAVM